MATFSSTLVDKFFTRTAVFLEAHADEVVVLVVGFVPLLALTGFIFFEIYLARPVDVENHPFVRFPWTVGAIAAAAALFRGDSPAVWALTAWGTVFLSSHFFHFCRTVSELAPPPLPAGYATSGVPWVAVCLYVFTVDLTYLFGWQEFAIFPMGVVRTTQAVYGVYFLGCHLVNRYGGRAATVFPGWNVSVYQGAMFGLFWKGLGVNGRSTAIAAGGATAVAAVTAHNNSSIERLRRQHEVDMQDRKVLHEVAIQKNQFQHDFLVEREKQKSLADFKQLELQEKGFSFTRVGNRFEKVRQPGWFRSPRQVVFPPEPSSKHSDPPDLLNSVCEEFVMPSWLVRTTLENDFFLVTVLKASFLFVGAIFLLFWVYRKFKPTGRQKL